MTLLFVDHATSVALVLLCWIFAHQCSGARALSERVVSACYGLVGVCTLGAMMFRIMPDFSHVAPYFEMSGRLALVLVLLALSLRDGRHPSS